MAIENSEFVDLHNFRDRDVRSVRASIAGDVVGHLLPE
jgi:hypothetical protein